MMALAKLKHHVSNAQLHQIADRGLSAIRRLQSMKAQAQEQAAIVIEALETSASTFGFSFARGYWAQPGQDVAIAGIPIDLVGAIVFHGMGFVGGMGQYKKDMHNFGNGALASYVATLGLKMGVEQASKHPHSTPAALLSPTPAAAAGYHYGVDDHALARAAYAMR
jgi:hypothetical protein